jgi:hypothetical protein
MLTAKNKFIPQVYREEILAALACYPELEDVEIHFRLKNHHPVPYGTTPSYARLLLRNERSYTVTLREKASPPEDAALFRNLPPRARVGVIAHELAHVLQFQKRTRWQLLRMTLRYLRKSFRQSIERGADLTAIDHGLGHELYEHAVYIRSIPGYEARRPAINEQYLKPAEITDLLRHPQYQHG